MNKLLCFLILSFYFPLSIYADLSVDLDSLNESLKKNPKDYKIHLLLSRYYFDKGEYNQSDYHINKAKSIKPDAPEVVRLDKIVHQHTKDIELLKKYNLSPTDSKDAFFHKLESLKQTDRVAEFEELLDYLIRTENDLEDRFYLLASDMMLKDTQLYKSRKLLEKATSLKNTSSYLSTEAKLCKLESNYLCSAKAYEQLYTLDKNEQEQLLAIEMYIMSNDYAKASQLLKQVPTSLHTSKRYEDISNRLHNYQKNRLLQLEEKYNKEQNLENLKLLCDALHNYKLYKEASKKLDEYYKKFGYSREFNKYAGDISYWNADTDKAIFYYSQIKDSDVDIQYKLGRLFSWKTSYKEALTALDKAQKLDSDGNYYYDIYRARAYIWLWQGDYDKSAKVFKELLKHTPDDLELQKAYKQAIDYRDGKSSVKIVKRKKSRVNHELQKATQFYDKSQYTESLGYFSYYLKKHPSDKLAQEKYAFALQKTQRYIEASKEYQKLYTETNSIRFLHHSAYNLYRAQKFDEASKLYEKIIAHYGSSDLGKIDTKLIDKNILMEYGNILEHTDRLNEAKLLYSTMLHKYARVSKLTKEHKELLNSWLNSWKNRQYNSYVSHYTKRANKWKQNKKQLFNSNKNLDINITAPRIIDTEADDAKEISTIRFLQSYSSKNLSDIGFKELDLECNSIGCLIKDERWKKARLGSVERYALERLKYIDSSKYRTREKNIPKKATQKTIPKIQKPKVVGDPIGSILKIKAKPKKSMRKKQSETNTSNSSEGYGYNAGFSGRLFSDSDKRHYKSVALNGGISFNENSAVNGSVGLFTLEEDFIDTNSSDKIDGQTFMLEYLTKSWTVGAFFDYYLDQMDFSPYIIYKTTLHSNFVNYLALTQYMQFKLYKRNLFVSKLSTQAMHQGIDKYAFKISDYMDFNRLSSLWFALDMAHVTDGNYILNFMFDYEMYKNNYRKFNYAFLLSGWYEHNKETKPEYYSPDIDDVTHLLINGYYPLDKNLNIKAQGGYGRNFKYGRNILRYGLWLETPRTSKTKFKLGCLRSQILNETVVSIDTLGYDFVDCKLDFNYNW
jgi:tetratricopeptide (TPR) repeat protein